MQQERLEKRAQRRKQELQRRVKDNDRLRKRIEKLLKIANVQRAILREQKHNPMMVQRAKAKLHNTLKNLANKLPLLMFGVRLEDEDLGPADEPPSEWGKPDPRWCHQP